MEILYRKWITRDSLSILLCSESTSFNSIVPSLVYARSFGFSCLDSPCISVGPPEELKKKQNRKRIRREISIFFC